MKCCEELSCKSVRYVSIYVDVIIVTIRLCFFSIDVSTVNAGDCNVHVLTSVLKSVFRDMPEPLMTYELYPDFIATSGN